MARHFVTAQYVNHGSGASLDNLPSVSGGFSVWAWVYPYQFGNNQHIMSKDGSFPSGWGFLGDESNGTLRFIVFRGASAGNWTDVISVSGVLPLNVWTFAAADFDDAATPEGRIFTGGLSTTVTETSYDLQQNGGAAISADAAYNLYVGNQQRNTSLFFNGRIQRGGIIYGVRPGASGFETIRLASLPTATNNPTQAEFFAAVQAVGTHSLLFDYQDGSVADLSGNGNDGTVTGATASELLNKLGLYEGQGAAGRIQGQAVSRSSLY